MRATHKNLAIIRLTDPQSVYWSVIMPTRAEMLASLAAAQAQIMTFVQGPGLEDMERPAPASGGPGATPWRAKDHLAHPVNSERAIQRLPRRALAGETRDVLLRLRYPADMPMPGILGALTPEEERLALPALGLDDNAER
jgi:hypothetical protein